MAWTTTSNELAGKIVAPVNRLLLDLDRALGLKVAQQGPEDAGAADDLPADTLPASPGHLSVEASTAMTGQYPHSTRIPRSADSDSQIPDITSPDSTVAGMSGIASRITGARTMPSIPPVTITPDAGHPQYDRPDAAGSSSSAPPGVNLPARDEPLENIAPAGPGESRNSPAIKQDTVAAAPPSQGDSQPRILRILPLTRRQPAPIVPATVQKVPGLAEDRTAPDGNQAPGPAATPKAAGNLLPLKVARAYRAPYRQSALVSDSPGPATATQLVNVSGLELLSSTDSQDFHNTPGAHLQQSAAPGQISPGQLAAPPGHAGPHRVPDLIPGAGSSPSHSNNLARHARPAWGGPAPGYVGRREMAGPSGAGPDRSGWLTLFPLEAGRVAERVSEKMGPSFQQADRLVRGTLEISPATGPQGTPNGNGASHSRVQNNFNVSVSIKGNGNEVDLDPEVLEEAIVNVLKDAARRHGLEV